MQTFILMNFHFVCICSNTQHKMHLHFIFYHWNWGEANQMNSKAQTTNQCVNKMFELFFEWNFNEDEWSIWISSNQHILFIHFFLPWKMLVIKFRNGFLFFPIETNRIESQLNCSAPIECRNVIFDFSTISISMMMIFCNYAWKASMWKSVHPICIMPFRKMHSA